MHTVKVDNNTHAAEDITKLINGLIEWACVTKEAWKSSVEMMLERCDEHLLGRCTHNTIKIKKPMMNYVLSGEKGIH